MVSPAELHPLSAGAMGEGMALPPPHKSIVAVNDPEITVDLLVYRHLVLPDLQDHHLRGWRIALLRSAVYGNQHIRLGEVGGGTPLRYAKWNYYELTGYPLHAIVVVEQVHHIASLQASLPYVSFIHKDYPALIMHTTVPVVQAIYGSIELIMTPYGHHHILVLLQVNR